jgi:hypothetical protein
MQNIHINHSFSNIYLWGLLLGTLLFIVPHTAWAQKDNPTFQDTRQNKNTKNDRKTRNYQGKDKKIKRREQGTGNTITQKVRAKSKAEMADESSFQSGYTGNVPYTDTKSKQRKSNQDASSYQGNVKYIDYKASRAKKAKKLSDHTGNIPMSAVKYKKKDAEYNAQERANYTGDVPYVNYKKKREQKAKDLSAYSGTIKYNRLSLSRKKRDKARDMADYSGTVKYQNIPRLRQQKAARLAAFKGPSPIRVKQKPKGSITSTYKGAPNKNRYVANYSRTKFKSGRTVKKSELPNYQKEKPSKVRYDSRETKMWKEGGGNMPTRTERKLPKTSKKAKRKSEQETQREFFDKEKEKKEKEDGGDN